ncbi:hypothetical protein TNCV_3863591 [Trichonephila clavipes]|uniref:Uncharacterized protein n=1 Tax=Trichonephila clavipes TaxID=2585209 RepID=A0A8X6S7E9_TRICX|nr:hypothetical protein TNCV_3863591 [Trichonephila clavipes]
MRRLGACEVECPPHKPKAVGSIRLEPIDFSGCENTRCGCHKIMWFKGHIDRTAGFQRPSSSNDQTDRHAVRSALQDCTATSRIFSKHYSRSIRVNFGGPNDKLDTGVAHRRSFQTSPGSAYPCLEELRR